MTDVNYTSTREHSHINIPWSIASNKLMFKRSSISIYTIASSITLVVIMLVLAFGNTQYYVVTFYLIKNILSIG
jgi:hypothetical protein